MNIIRSLTTVLLPLALFIPGTQNPAHAAGRCYVDIDATDGNNDGSNWADAYTSLQSALGDTCTEIWVAAGTYNPHDSDRAVSFNLENGVAVYGGFSGIETLLGERDYQTNITILSGDLNGDDVDFINNSENSYHVVVGSGTDNTAILDGFTITGGNANIDPHLDGGGVFINAGEPLLNNRLYRN